MQRRSPSGVSSGWSAPPHNGDAIWDFRGRKAAWVARGMVAMMRGDRPAILLNPEIYANT
jgi:hypothetical protein